MKDTRDLLEALFEQELGFIDIKREDFETLPSEYMILVLKEVCEACGMFEEEE